MRRFLRMVLTVGSALAVAWSLSTPAQASASPALADHTAGSSARRAVPQSVPPESGDPQCANPSTRTVPGVGSRRVYYCPIWESAPVTEPPCRGTMAEPCPQGDKGGVLWDTGYANWFVCQSYLYDRYGRQWYALSEADNGAWGWVSGYYYSGSTANWPSQLPGCDSTILRKY